MADQENDVTSVHNYLSAVAFTLKKIKDGIEDEHVRAQLTHCVCALSGLMHVTDTKAADADFLERVATIAGGRESREFDPIPLGALPESLAVTPLTAAAILRGAQWIDAQEDTPDEGVDNRVIELVRDEYALIDRSMNRMLALQNHEPWEGDGHSGSTIAPEDVSRLFERSDLPTARGEVVSFRQIFGGRSRQTALVSIRHPDDRMADYVIQRDSPVAGKPQSVVDEFPLLQTLHSKGLKVPKPIFVEADANWLGAPFMVVDKVAGNVAEIDYFGAPASTKLVEQFAGQLAKLHALDVDASLKLKTTASEDGPAGWASELEDIAAGWNTEKNWPSISVSAALHWMKRHVGDLELERRIVHGDPAFHNVLCDGDEMTALLDWELAHVGHPAEDLGYCRGAVSQIIPWPEFVALYEQAGGRKFSPVTLDYFSLRAAINIMFLIQKIRKNIDDGTMLDVGVADLGASFIPKLTHRISRLLIEVLET